MDSFYILCCWALIILQAGTTIVAGDDYIFRGTTVRTDEFSYQAQITIKKPFSGGVAWCGGTIISPTHIMTAAHCLAETADGLRTSPYVMSGAANVTAYVGSTRALMGTKHRVARALPHRDFDYVRLYNDIALLTLSQPMKLGRNVSTARLPTKKISDYADNSYVTVSGWGGVNNIPGNVSYDLQYLLNQPILGYCTWENHGEFCAGGNRGEGTCRGDSGGPAVLGNPPIVVGITSGSSWKGCAAGDPDYYTNVRFYIGWLCKAGVSEACRIHDEPDYGQEKDEDEDEDQDEEDQEDTKEEPADEEDQEEDRPAEDENDE